MHSLSDFGMSVGYKGVLMENLEACMQHRIATSLTTIGIPYNVDFFMVEGCATFLLSSPLEEVKGLLPHDGGWICLLYIKFYLSIHMSYSYLSSRIRIFLISILYIDIRFFSSRYLKLIPHIFWYGDEDINSINLKHPNPKHNFSYFT